MTDHITLIFVAAVLNSLPEKWRGVRNSQSFEKILKARGKINLHSAWDAIDREGLTGNFFPDFTIDPLYERSNLEQVLAQGVRHLLVRQSGWDFGYHLDLVDAESLRQMLERAGIPADIPMLAAARLNEILEEQEVENSSPANA